MKIIGVPVWKGILHELMHWCFSLLVCSGLLCLSWVTSWLIGYDLATTITSTSIFWWLGLWVSCSVVLHCLADGLLLTLPPHWEAVKEVKVEM